MQQPIEKQRIALSFILGNAITKILPNVKLIQNGTTDSGFYYDISGQIVLEDLDKIKKEMDEIVTNTLIVKQYSENKEEAEKIFKDNEYKLNMIKEYDLVDLISFNDFIDIGSDILNFQDILTDSFTLETISKREGDVKRVQGVSYNNKNELRDQYLQT